MPEPAAGTDVATVPRFLARDVDSPIAVTPDDIAEAVLHWPDMRAGKLLDRIVRERFHLANPGAIEARIRWDRLDLGMPARVVPVLDDDGAIVGVEASRPPGDAAPDVEG